MPVSQHLAYLRKAGWVESWRHAQWKVYRLLPSLSPALRAVLDGLLSAAKTQTLLFSDLEDIEAILKDPRYSFCCFATPTESQENQFLPALRHRSSWTKVV